MQSLQKAGIRLMVLSNNREKRVAGFCKPLNIPYISKTGKPRPDSLLRALAELQTAPGQAVMVGDQVRTDVRSAKRAGIRVVLVDPFTGNWFFRLRRWLEGRYVRAAVLQENNKNG